MTTTMRRGRVGPTGQVVMTVPEVEANEAAWHRARCGGVTATDMRVLTGHGYAEETVYGRWARKVDPDSAPPERDDADIDDDDLRLHLGLAIEPRLAEIAAARIGVTVKRTGLLRNVNTPILLADPDRATSDGGGMELKRTGRWYLQKWAEHPGPQSVYGAVLSPAWETQVQHQMLVTGWPHVHVVAYEADQDRLHHWKVDADPARHEQLAQRAAEFWEHVESHTPPPLDWAPLTDREVKARYPEANGEALTLDAGQAEQATRLLLELQLAEGSVKPLTAQVESIKQQLRAIAGDHSVVTDPTGRELWTWNQQTKAGFDTKALLRDQPELADQYRKVTSYRVLRIKKTTNNNTKDSQDRSVA